jgi:hypothetical protein
VYEREGRIVLSLHGQYTGQQAADGVRMASELFRRLGRSEFVVDLRELKGYDTDARAKWQEKLSEFRGQIHTVTMIGGSPLTRMTGAAVCLYAGIKMRFLDDIEFAFPPRATQRTK